MNEKFIDGLMDYSLKILEKCAEGEPITSNEMKLLMWAQRLSAQQNKKDPIDQIINIANKAKPLISMFISGGSAE